ncbi:uncharacterized protein LOC112873084 [Panicum hallii]|nr:uncharacterized protein LOC112873084 [Panicum hallii]
MDNYIGKVAGQFNMDTDNKAVKDACIDLLKGGQRQRRYNLKLKYFNGLSQDQVPRTSPVACMSDAQWLELVAMWSKEEHKEKCAKNKINRECVQYQQRTGSQCYEAQAYVAKQERFKDSTPTAIDLFKEMHCSRKRDFSEQVKQAIVDMESIIDESIENGEQQKTCIEAVSQVLSKNSTFLENLGLKKVSRKKSRIDVSSHIERLQFELDAKTQESAGLREAPASSACAWQRIVTGPDCPCPCPYPLPQPVLAHPFPSSSSFPFILCLLSLLCHANVALGGVAVVGKKPCWARPRSLLTAVYGVGEETGLPLIPCPFCGRARVIELRANTTENGNEGRVFFKCPRRGAQMGGRCDYFSWQREYLDMLVSLKIIQIHAIVDGEPIGAPGNASREASDLVSGRLERNAMEEKVDSLIRAIKMLVVVMVVGAVLAIMYQLK